MVQKTKECPLVVDIMGIVLGVIGAIVAIGLALILMWKVFTTIHDRREFARFEKERMLAKWDTVSKWTFKKLCMKRKISSISSSINNQLITLLGRESNIQTSDLDVQESNLCWKVKKQVLMINIILLCHITNCCLVKISFIVLSWNLIYRTKYLTEN